MFLSASLESAIAEFAVDSFLKHVGPKYPSSVPGSPVKTRQPTSPTSPSISTSASLLSQKLHFVPPKYNLLSSSDIARYLEDATASKLGDWPVVVSQRGIKHLRQHIQDDMTIFQEIEKKIKYAIITQCYTAADSPSCRQLSVGYFPEANQTKLLGRDFGIPIYVAHLKSGLRLIYHIDFGAPTGTSEESQCESALSLHW